MPPFSVPTLPSFPSIPSLPQLPSATSIRALLDPEPQVFYPAPKSPNRPRSRTRHDSGSDAGCRSPVSPGRHQRSHRAYPIGEGSMLEDRQQGLSRGAMDPSRVDQLHMASRSAVDLTGWKKVNNPLTDFGRRHSISSKRLEYRRNHQSSAESSVMRDDQPQLVPPEERGRSASSLYGSPNRPGHRRAHSALPKTNGLMLDGVSRARNTSSSAMPAPLGRLHDFCRNPLASSSAVSLPTLAEGEVVDSLEIDRVPPSPSFRPHRRSSSRVGISIVTRPSSSYTASTAPTSPTPSLGGLSSLSESCGSDPRPISPFSFQSDLSCPSDQGSFADDSDIVNKAAGDMDRTPQASEKMANRMKRSDSASSSSVPPPQGLDRLRPPPSPRAWSTGAVPRHRAHSTSFSLPIRSVSTGTTSVSDVAVMATWAFPTSPERTQEGGERTGQSLEPKSRTGRPSHRLKETLQNLSQLDTNSIPKTLSTFGSHAPKRQATVPNQRADITSLQSRHDIPTFRFPAETLSTSSSAVLPHPEATEQISGIRPTHHSQQRVQHRHTHSSPLLLHPQHRQKPTASGHDDVLRNTSQSELNRPRTTSNYSGLPEPESRLPTMPELTRSRSAALSPKEFRVTQNGVYEASRWWTMRRFSVSGVPPSVENESQLRAGGLESSEEADKIEGAGQRVGTGRGDSPENERFLDFDDI